MCRYTTLSVCCSRRRRKLYPIGRGRCQSVLEGAGRRRVGVGGRGLRRHQTGDLFERLGAWEHGWPSRADLGSRAVTTVTSSDRGDAGSTRSQRGARSASSDIPGQRAGGAAGGQALRILVLGSSAEADELRRRAAEAGAELAQRFSARVTHVVTEPGVPADDARVAGLEWAAEPERSWIISTT